MPFPFARIVGVTEEAKVTLTFVTQYVHKKRLPGEYWEGRREGGSSRWTETVTIIADRHGIPKHRLPATLLLLRRRSNGVRSELRRMLLP
jgi:hypothetical protein